MKNPKFIFILLLNTLLLILAIWFKPRFQTNDDIGMIYAYSGTAIFDSPTAVTAFSTKTFGLLMILFYQILPKGIEVYTFVLFALIFLSNIIIHTKIFEKLNYKGPIFWVFFIPLLVFITLNFYLELQFTMVTGLLCFASVLLMVNNTSKKEMALSLILFSMACLLRPSLIPIILLFLFILNLSVTYIFPQFVDSRKQIIKRFGLFAVLLCSVYFIDKETHTKEEKHFIEFNIFRAGIVDFDVDKTSNFQLPSDWGKEELLLFKNWFYNDTFLFSQNKSYKIEKLEYRNDYIEKIRIGNISFFFILRQFINPLFRGILICFLIITMVTVLLAHQWRKCLFFLSIVLINYIIFYYTLAILFKAPPFRVSFILFTSGFLFYINFIVTLVDIIYANILKVLSIISIFICGLFIMKTSWFIRYQDISEIRCDEKYKEDIMYIRWASYPFELVDPFNVSKGLDKIKIVSMGAFSVHPAINKRFLGFNYLNLTKDIIGKDKVVSFIMPEDLNQWEDFKFAYIGFIMKHYKKKVYFEKVENSKHCFGFAEYKLKERI